MKRPTNISHKLRTTIEVREKLGRFPCQNSNKEFFSSNVRFKHLDFQFNHAILHFEQALRQFKRAVFQFYNVIR